MIKIENASKSFGSQKVLVDISLDIKTGETLAIVGPSGTGKSVLLKLITGLMSPDSGNIIIDGDSVLGKKKKFAFKKMGILFQTAALLDSLSLFDNLVFPLRWEKKISESEILDRGRKLLSMVGMDKYGYYRPDEVSIGHRKRLGIARALITNPKYILFDEPNTGLDPQAGQDIYDLIKKIQMETDVTGIVISHEIPEVFQICDKVIMLYRGNIQESGTVENFTATKDPIVQQFINGNVQGPMVAH